MESKISAPVVRESLAEVGPLPKPIPAAARRKPEAAGLPLLSPELVLRLTWSKLLELIRLDDPVKRAFYETECLEGNWSKRQLQRQIGSLLFGVLWSCSHSAGLSGWEIGRPGSDCSAWGS